MASILQHQVESRVNDLYLKMQQQARVIMRLSLEVDRLSKENDELASLVMKNKGIIKKLVDNQNIEIINSQKMVNDITTQEETPDETPDDTGKIDFGD